jgi:peptidoglycan-associated lipoprotein
MKVLGLFAALLLVAACETTPEETAGTGGEGAVGAGAGEAGVTQGPVPGSVDDFVLNVGDRVFFDFDKSVLKAEARATLERQAEWLKKYPDKIITIEGHADERGTREYNLALGERRATAAKDYLVALGVDTSRITTISYGKERPFAVGHNEAAWALNRRAVTVISN